MASEKVNSSEHWRERAEEVRALAKMLDDAEVKSKLLQVAAEYDRLAERGISTRPKRHVRAG